MNFEDATEEDIRDANHKILEDFLLATRGDHSVTPFNAMDILKDDLQGVRVEPELEPERVRQVKGEVWGLVPRETIPGWICGPKISPDGYIDHFSMADEPELAIVKAYLICKKRGCCELT